MRITATMNRIEAALEKVRKLHPLRGQSPELPSSTILDEVREKLRACNPERLADLAYSFDISRIMARLELVVSEMEMDVANKAGDVLVLRPRTRVITAGWFRLTRHYPKDLLEKVLRANIEAKGFRALVGLKKVSNRIPAWFLSNRLSEGALRDYERADGFRNLDAFLDDNFLDPEDGLYRELWRLLLKGGGANIIQREDPGRMMIEYQRPENAQHTAAFCQHYLNALKSRIKWDDRILRFVEKKFGAPIAPEGSRNIETPFWSKVDPGAKKEFHTWLMLQRIEEFFEGERADFWRQYVVTNKVARVKKILDGQGFMIDFGLFGVVEFKNIGNAAYIYPVDAFRVFWSKGDYERFVSRFKHREKTVRHRSYHGWDGRIIHRLDWQRETSFKIKALMGK